MRSFFIKKIIVPTLVFLLSGSLSIAADDKSPITLPEDSSMINRIHELEFKSAKISDIIRVLAEQSGVNIIATQEAGGKTVTIYLKDVSVREAIESIARISDLWYRRDNDNGTFRLMTLEEYRKDLVIHKNDNIRVFNLLNPNTRIIAQAIEDLYGDRVELSLGLDPAQEQEFVQTGGGIGGTSGFSSFSNRSNTRNTNRQSRFNSRSSSSNFSGSSRASGGGITSEDREITEKLSVDQIENISRLGGALDTRISADLLQDFTIQSSTIFVTVNNEHNQLIVRTGDNDAMESIARLVEQMDKPVPQVLLEMKVLDILIGDDFRSLLNLEANAGSSNFTDSVTGELLPSNSFLLGNFPLEGGTFIYEFLSDNFRALLEILIQKNRINVLSKPIILASNNRPAELFIGEETVITTGVSSDVITSQVNTNTFLDTETEVRQVGNRITITPFINTDNTITLALQQETSSVNRNGATVIVQTGTGVAEVPIDTINTATVDGTIVAKHGYTMAVGGLIRNTKSKTTSKVPVLGDIPILGTLFRREQQNDEHRELILLITPYVMKKGDEYESVTRVRLTDPSRYQEWDNERVPLEIIKPSQELPGTLEDDLEIYEKNRIRPNSDGNRTHNLFNRETNPAPTIRNDARDTVTYLLEAAAVDQKPREAVSMAVNDSVPTPLFVDRRLVVYPRSTWKYENLYVTQVTVKNLSATSIEINRRGLRGWWLAAKFNTELLGAHGETEGYLVSEIDYMRNLAAIPVLSEIAE